MLNIDTRISLEVLILNDLYAQKIINETVYRMALGELSNINKGTKVA